MSSFLRRNLLQLGFSSFAAPGVLAYNQSTAQGQPRLAAPFARVASVRDFGAAGDGRTKDTAAIQRTIDACAAAGGGVAYCPPGTYLSGTIQLKNNVELHLEAGATILGSPDRSDYLRVFTGPHISRGFNFDQFLLYARNARGIAITGRDTIDGSGRAFMVSPAERRKERGTPAPAAVDRLSAALVESFLEVRDWRPGPMLSLIDCRDVVLRDLNLYDSPSYGVWSVGCERVSIHGINLRSDRRTPNGDGIQLCGCCDVRISDCSIYAGDDAVCAYGYPRWLGATRPCENVTVTNCTLSTPCCGVRIGYSGDSPIRNFTLSNLAMHNCRTGIDLLCGAESSWQLEGEPFTEHGPMIENISFANLTMDTRMAIFLWIGGGARPPACIRNISISDVIATTIHTCYIGGSEAVPIEDVRIDHLKLTVRGEMDDRYIRSVPDPISCWRQPGIPHAFYLRHARNIELSGIRVAWGGISGPWRSAVRAEDVENLDLNGFIARQALPDSDAAAIHLTHIRGASLRGCRCEAGTNTFLRLEGAESTASLIGNDLKLAREVFQLGAGVPGDAVSLP
jgi:hypothetical protein